MSTNLTPEQARALRVARIALDGDARSVASADHRLGALREALQQILYAFPEDEL